MDKPHDFITIKDEQTGLEYKIRLEDAHAARVAVFAMLYLLFMLMFLLWMLFDIWIGRNLLLGWLGYDRTRLAGNAFQLVAYVVIGGALGGTISGIRSIIFWHSQYRAYGPRFVWKDLALPLTGATLGIMVYAGVRSGAGAINGDFSLNHAGAVPGLAAFAIASLAGFSSHRVFPWLDDKARNVFKATKSAGVRPKTGHKHDGQETGEPPTEPEES